MNYRRGFQRLYCLVALGWAAAVCVAYKWSPAQAESGWIDVPPEAPAGSDGSSYVGPVKAEATPPAALTDEDVSRHRREEQQMLRDFLSMPQMEQIKILNKANDPREAPVAQRGSVALFGDPKDPLVQGRAPLSVKIGRAIERSQVLRGIGVATVPPILGYVLLFEVLRWVRQGFRAEPAAPSTAR